MNKPHLKYEHVHVVFRVDHPVNDDHTTDSISLLKVFRSEAAAAAETERLNKLNASKACEYLHAVARFIDEPKI